MVGRDGEAGDTLPACFRLELRMGLETGVEVPCLAGLATLSFAERDLLDGTPKLSRR